MSFKGIYTVFRKDLLSAIGDKTILLIVVIPILISVVIPFLMSSADNMTAPIVVYDEGNNTEFIHYLESVSAYNITAVGSPGQLKEALDSGDAAVAMTIPPGFDGNVRDGKRPLLHVMANPDKVEFMIFTSTYRDVLMNFSGQEFPVNVTMESVSVKSGGASLFSAQGIIPMVIMLTTVLLGISILPYTLTTEKEKKTLDAILVTPASEKDVIYGKMLFGLFLTMGIALLVLALNGGFTGNVLFTLSFILLGATACIGLGLLIGSYSDTYMTASVISSIAMLPLLMVPMFGSLSEGIALVAKALPSTYMYNGLSDSMYGSGTLQGMLVGLAILAGFNAVIYALTIYVVRRKRNTANR